MAYLPECLIVAMNIYPILKYVKIEVINASLDLPFA